MKYLGGAFSVAIGSDEYRENWDRIFKKKKSKEPPRPLTLLDLGCEPAGEECPRCGKPAVFGAIDCPEGKVGCITLHRGIVCSSCNWTKT